MSAPTLTREDLRARPLVSVVIAVRDMESTIGHQLEALAGQDFAGEWEVIMVDDGSRDSTVAVAAGWAERLPLRILRTAGPPDTAGARNVGVAAARAGLLAFCDGDDVVGQGWLAAMVGALSGAPLVTGPLDYTRLNTAKAAAALQSGAPGVPGWRLESEGIGGNCGVRRTVFEAVGGFPEGYGLGEDTAFFWMAQLAGYGLAPEPAAVVHYRLKGGTRRAMFQRFYRHGRTSVRHYERFRAHGMRRSPARDVIYDWGTIPIRYVRGQTYRAAQQAGWRLGRLAGSARSRTLCL